MSSLDTGTGAKLEAKAINPSFTVNDLEKSLAFYVDGFGFEIERQSERDGKVVFAMLKAGNARLGIGQDDFAKGRDRQKGAGLRNWINTDQDLDALAERAKKAGIKLDYEPQKLPWGSYAFGFTDLDGFMFTVTNG
jgi:uncharacterized glyoxalase superfamily protein PhnB